MLSLEVQRRYCQTMEQNLKISFFEKVAKELGVEFKCYIAPYHPQSNGRIEGFHHFLKACMSKHISKTMEWDEVVHLATAAYNFFPNEHSIQHQSILFNVWQRS